jgi:hypothetical protein
MPERIAPPVGSHAHQRLLELIRSRRALSTKALSEHYPKWRKADRLYKHYVAPDEVDPAGKRLYPYARSIVVPLTFAIVQTQLAWEMAAFTGRVPIVPLSGVSPEDQKPAKVMEQCLNYEWNLDRMHLPLYQWLLDRRRYGVGVLWVNWVREATRQWVETPRRLDIPLLGLSVDAGTVGAWQDRVKYEGNRLEPIDPFYFYPDPRVPIGQCQRGEYVGFRTRRHYHELLLMERDGQYANVEELPRVARRPSPVTGLTEGISPGRDGDRGERQRLSDWMLQIGGNAVDFIEHGEVDLDIFVIRIIPKDYDLGRETAPQKYVVVAGNQAVILRAQRYEHQHDELPACVIELTPDRHAYTTPGVVEHLEDLQDALSWMYNSHMENVRRTLNNQFVADPSVVEIADLLQPQPGLIARIRREYQGRPGALDNAIKQLPMTDVTRTHMQDMDLMINLMQRVAAAPENLQGILAAGDRTLGEQQLALSAAAGRLRLEAQLAWIQGMNRVTHQRISNIQQYMQESRWIQIVGTYPRALGIPIDQKFLRVGPDEVQGQFTYELIDAMVRSDEAMLRALREVWLAVAQNPELQQRFDVVELFKPIAMMAGLKNIDEYTRGSPAEMGGIPQPGQPAAGLPPSPATPPGAPSPMPVVRPDEEVMRQVAAGNLVAA